jgi:hypothetical protein
MSKEKMPLMKKIKITGVIVAILVLAIGIYWGSFHFKRWAHYNLYYKGAVQQQIQQEIAPLERRIDELERKLEKK